MLDTADTSLNTAAANPRGDVVGSLVRADAEIRAAIDAFKRARQFRFTDLFRPANTDPGHVGSEEVHVTHGMNAMLNAGRLVGIAAETVHALPAAHPARRDFGAPVRQLDTEFKALMVTLQLRSDPSKLLTGLKRARRAVPTRLVRQYTKD